MSDESTLEQGGGQAAPVTENKPPKSDAEAAQREAQKPEASNEEEAKKAEEAKQAEEKTRKNRTRGYITRLQTDNAELRRLLDELRRSPVPQQPQRQSVPQDRGPTLEEYNYDPDAYQAARDQWLLNQARQSVATEYEQRQARQREEQLAETYDRRIADFVEDHPDFFEAVGSIDPAFLSPPLEAAIMGHEMGPAIAYHLANNEEALWGLASVRPELLPQAIYRLASRLGAAPAPQQPLQAPPPAVPQKPITQAPPPPPQVAGSRATASVDPAKQTDDDWYRSDRERRRKR